MFSLVPVLLLAVFILGTMHYLVHDSIEKVDSQEKLNMLVVIADYVVKDAGAYSDGTKIYPNLIDPQKLGGLETEFGENAGVEGLFIGLESEGGAPSDELSCIYRIVARHPGRETDRLFVCG